MSSSTVLHCAGFANTGSTASTERKVAKINFLYSPDTMSNALRSKAIGFTAASASRVRFAGRAAKKASACTIGPDASCGKNEIYSNTSEKDRAGRILHR